MGGFLGVPLYRREAVAVKLSIGLGASVKGEAEIKYFPMGLLAWRRAFVVWPGLMKMVSVLKGLV